MGFREDYEKYNDLHFKRKQLLERLRALRVSSETAKGIRYDQIPGANGYADPNLQFCIRIEEVETRLKDVESQISELRRILIRQIRAKFHPGKYQSVAIETLVNRESCEDLAADCCRSVSRIKQMRAFCLKKLTES